MTPTTDVDNGMYILLSDTLVVLRMVLYAYFINLCKISGGFKMYLIVDSIKLFH